MVESQAVESGLVFRFGVVFSFLSFNTWPSLILRSPCCYLALVYVLSPVSSPSLLPVAPALLSLSVNPVRAHGIKAFSTGTMAVSKSFDLGCAHELRAEWGSQCHVKISFSLQDVLSVLHSRYVSSPPH